LKNITRNLKSVNKKRKRNCDSDREDSDLSWSDGSSSRGN
jgi:hypothetical protein